MIVEEGQNCNGGESEDGGMRAESQEIDVN